MVDISSIHCQCSHSCLERRQVLHFPRPCLEKAFRLLHGSETLESDVARSMSTVHIHSGASSAPCTQAGETAER